MLDTPVDAVVLTFTESAQPAGDGILIITAADEQVAATVSQVDDTTIQITPEEPLTGGAFAVGCGNRLFDPADLERARFDAVERRYLYRIAERRAP